MKGVILIIVIVLIIIYFYSRNLTKSIMGNIGKQKKISSPDFSLEENTAKEDLRKGLVGGTAKAVASYYHFYLRLDGKLGYVADSFVSYVYDTRYGKSPLPGAKPRGEIFLADIFSSQEYLGGIYIDTVVMSVLEADMDGISPHNMQVEKILLRVISEELKRCNVPEKYISELARGKLPSINLTGLSVENAVVVHSVQDEYLWLGDYCAGYELESKALQKIDNKMYDVMTLCNKVGKKKVVYFYIS